MKHKDIKKGWYFSSPLHKAVKEYKTTKPSFKKSCICWDQKINNFFVSLFSINFAHYEKYGYLPITDFLNIK